MNKRKPRTFQKRILRWILIGVPVVVLVMAAGTLAFFYVLAKSFEGTTMFSNGCPSDEPAGIENMARFKLPPSAENLESFCSGMQGWGASAKFDMSPDDLDTFINSVWVKTTLSETGTPRYITDRGQFLFDVPFAQMTSYLHSYEESGTDLVQEILIDTSNPARYTVYLLILAG